MAASSYAVNHPLAVKAWRKALFQEAIKKTWFSKFMGSGSDSLIQTLDDLQKGPGDRVRVGLRMLLTGDGTRGDNTLEGNEEALTLYYDDLYIDQLRHAVRSGGMMSEQRVPFSTRNEAKEGLSDWWAERLEKWAANQLVGNTGETNLAYTGNNSVSAVDTSHAIFAGESSEASVSTGTAHQFSLTLIDRCVVKARTLSPRIRPLRIKGKEYFAMFLHPYQVYQMRTSTSTAQWADIQKAAFAGMDASDNPIFTGALGIYNGVVLHEAPYLPGPFSGSATAGSTIRRASFCGAQAAVFATGRSGGNADEMNWVEKYFDYENQLGVSAGMIGGLKRTRFNNADFATVTVSSYSPDPG